MTELEQVPPQQELDDDTGVWVINGDYDEQQQPTSERTNQPRSAYRNIELGLLEV